MHPDDYQTRRLMQKIRDLRGVNDSINTEFRRLQAQNRESRIMHERTIKAVTLLLEAGLSVQALKVLRP